MRIGMLLLCGIACAAPAFAASEGDVERAIDDLATTVRELATRRARFADRLPGRPEPDRRSGVLELVLVGALDGHDLEIQLLRRDGAFVDGRATAPGWGPIVYRVRPLDLELSGDRVAGTFRVDLMPWTGMARHHPDQGRVRPATYAVEDLLGDDADGVARHRTHAEAPYPAGPFAAEARWIALRRPEISALPDPPGALPFELAEWWHARACELWEELRALEIATRTGLPYPIAREQVARLRLSWPRPEGAPEGDDDGPVGEVAGDGGIEDELMAGLDEELAEMTVDAGPLLAAVAPMRDHARAQLAAIDAALSAEEVPAVVVGNADCGDPDFAPGSASDPLPVSDDGVFELPQDLGADGPTRWVHPARWRMLGPFPTVPWSGHSPRMPDLVPAFAARFVVDTAPFAWKHSAPYAGDPARGWEWVPSRPLTGRFHPPAACKHTYVREGMEWAGFYGHLDVVAERDRDCWVAVVSSYAAQIWLDGRLVWRSGRLGADPQGKQHQWLARLPLKAGRNRLTLRLDESTIPVFAALRFCVGGGPRDAAGAAAAIAAREERYRELESPFSGTVQFRRDHTGLHPDAEPVLAWDVDEGVNVAWRRRIGPTNAGPVLAVGETVITTEEPNVIVAMDAATGDVRWRRRMDRMEFVDPAVWAKAEPLWREVDSLSFEDEGERARRVALIEELSELYPEKWRPEITAKPKGGFAGEAMSTPASDGERIWCMMGGKLLGCFRLADGTREWLVETGGSGGGMGHSATSPVLWKDRIIAVIPVYGQEGLEPARWDVNGGWHWERQAQRRQVLRCWDARTGEVLWTGRKFRAPNFGNRYDADAIPTPHLVRLTDGERDLEVLITGGGQVWRAEDGKLLLPHCGIETRCPTPVPIGPGRVAVFSTTDYHKSGGVVAGVELLLEDRDHVRAKRLWTSRWHDAVGYGGYVHHDGVLHGARNRERHLLWALDAGSGEILDRRGGLAWRAPGHVYASPAIAGGVLFIAGDGRSRWNKTQLFRHQGHIGGEALPYEPANMTAVLPGPEPVILARNRLRTHDGTTFPPAFSGERTFVRQRGEIWCLAPTDGGAAYQAAIVAKTILAQLQLDEPTEVEPVDATLRRRPASTEDAAGAIADGEVLRGFWAVGPATADGADARAAALELAAGAPWYLDERHERAEELLGMPLRVGTRDDGKELPDGITTGDHRFGLAYDLARVHRGEEDTVCFWVTSLFNERTATWRLDLPGDGIRCRIGGVELAHGDRVSLGRGWHPVVIRTAYDGDRHTTMRPRLWRSDEVAAERDRRRARIARVAPYLRSCLEALEDETLVRRVGGLLDEP